jgi:hypothetical protein
LRSAVIPRQNRLSCLLTSKQLNWEYYQFKTATQRRKIMTGQELRQLLINKWGHSYDLQFRRTQGKIFLQVMWKYLEQASFPLSESEYQEHLDSIANYLNALGGTQQVQSFITLTKERPRLGKAVSIPIDLGERASEWVI